MYEQDNPFIYEFEKCNTIFHNILISFIFILIFFYFTIFRDIRDKYFINQVISFYVREKGEKRLLSAPIKEFIAYNDVWRGHWCPYYNDRMVFLNPRINELLQLFRAYRIQTIHVSFASEASFYDFPQRISANKILRFKQSSQLKNFTAHPENEYHNYIPNFEDKCNDFVTKKFSKFRDVDFAKPIAISQSDYFIANFKEGVHIANALHKKYMFITGDHTNMCLMHAMIYCQKVGIIPIIVEDLVDSAWTYQAQSKTIPTHSKSNFAVNHYVEEKMGMTALSYDIISGFETLKIPLRSIRYTYNTKYSKIFKKFR